MLDAATALLVASGPRSVTVDAVSEASGVAKSTLYRHWSSRDELLISVVRESVSIIEVPNASGGFEPALRELIHSAAEAFSDPEWSRMFSAISSLRTAMPELDDLIEIDVEEKRVAVSAIMSKGVEEGAIPDFDIEQASHLLIGPLAFAALTAPRTGLPEGELHRLADVVVERFLASYRS